MASVKASKQGLVQIRNAIAKKEWNMSDDRWSLAASSIIDSSKNWEEEEYFAYGCSKSTRERLLNGDPIREKAFRAFCEALELNPSDVAENLEPASELKPSQWQAIHYGCSQLLNQDYLIPEAQKPVVEILDIATRRISIEKNELTQKLLPRKFKVYVKGESLISHPKFGYEEKVLLTINRYKGEDGGYVGCYTHNQKIGVCSVGGNIYLIGQIRLPGEYFGRIFVPEGCEGEDISTVPWIKDLCNKYFPSAKGDVWAGGDTGGWFEFPTSIG